MHMDRYIPELNTTIDDLVKNRVLFNQFIYTPVEQAIAELNKRRDDEQLKSLVAEEFTLPAPLQNTQRAVLFRQVATPNHEVIRFLTIAELMGLPPLFWEYHKDKFVPNNEVKYYLGNLAFYNGRGKKGGAKFEYKKIIDFNSSNGKPIGELKT